MADTVMPGLERRLKAQLLGDVEFDAFTRGRYATDASHYQIMPIGVVAPRSIKEIEHTLALARQEGVSVLPRGAGTSQAGQTVNASLVIDCSKYLDHLVELDVPGKRCVVEPGIVLDELNRRLKPHGLWFPVDISTSSRATIGGMVGNNSCGARSLRYGNTRENVLSIDAVMADGTAVHFGPTAPDLSDLPAHSPLRPVARTLLDLAAREADEIETQFPKVQRRVGGYNLDALTPGRNRLNLAHILVGSEGTLAFSTRIELALSPVLGARAVGACHFGSFAQAMDVAQYIVKLRPIAVELVDRTMLGLARDIAMFKPTIDAVVRGDPEAILFVEFAEPDQSENFRRLFRLNELVGDLGFGWDKPGAKWGGVIEVLDPKLQSAIGEMRTAGLNIMMSMKQEGKPVSFVEDSAVPLEHLAEYTGKLTAIFEKHGTRGTWYAHASVGCLHVRPVLDLRLDKDVIAMRAIAEEAFDLVRTYKGSHSGEHGDGIVRSEFHERMFGPRLVRAFEEVKACFDPNGFYNPGKIVHAPKFDDRRVFRYAPGYRGADIQTHLDWSAYPGAAGGLQGAVEMCNNNGACRALKGGVMCPSYRVTRDERDVTRGRANTLRLALTGQLGPDALVAEEMRETMDLCISCKGCKRECPTGVDMARMKVEFLHHYRKRHRLTPRDRLIAYLPRYASHAARIAPLMNLRNRLPLLAAYGERRFGLSARRQLPRWSAHPYRGTSSGSGREVVLLVDTFNRYFESENAYAAERVLTRAGYQVLSPDPPHGRPLCCGRTFLSAGLMVEARVEARRILDALAPHVAAGTPIIGLEPSCLLTLRDEFRVILPGAETKGLAERVQLFEEFVDSEREAKRFRLPLSPREGRTALLHGHCHQKAFGTVAAAVRALRLIPGLAVETLDATCCGMAGSFGYEAEHYEMSLKIGELGVLPKMRAAAPDTLLAANGTSCRHQIADGAGREARHIVRILDDASAGA